jgi:4-alpha-glucanotransferase
VIAEDLGTITPAVEQLRDELRLPGMLILQFAFAESLKNPQRVGDTDNVVVYTGTHDNPTTREWWEGASATERRNVLDAIGGDGDPVWGMIRLALRSQGRLSIVPAQDVLGLGAEARMNTPGRAEGNWRWRLRPGELTDDLAARLREETEAAGR